MGKLGAVQDWFLGMDNRVEALSSNSVILHKDFQNAKHCGAKKCETNACITVSYLLDVCYRWSLCRVRFLSYNRGGIRRRIPDCFAWLTFSIGSSGSIDEMATMDVVSASLCNWWGMGPILSGINYILRN